MTERGTQTKDNSTSNNATVKSQLRSHVITLLKYRVYIYSLICFIISVVLIYESIIIEDRILEEILLVVGTTILGIGGISVLSELVFKMGTLKLFEDTFSRNWNELSKDMRLIADTHYHFSKAGFRGLGDRTKINYLQYFLVDAKEKLKQQGISLPLMDDQRCADTIINRVLDENDPLKIQILLLNPWSLISSKRAACKGYASATQYHEDLIQHIWRYMKIGEEIRKRQMSLVPDKYDVRLYDSLPYCSMLLKDDIVNFSIYLENVLGSKTVCFEVQSTNRPGDFYSTLEEHFDICWSESVSIFSPGLSNLIRKVMDNEIKTIKNKPLKRDIERLLPRTICLDSSFMKLLHEGTIDEELRKLVYKWGHTLGDDARIVSKGSNIWILQTKIRKKMKKFTIEDKGTQINIVLEEG